MSAAADVQNLFAVPDAVSGAEAGSITWWKLSGSVDAATLRAAWEEHAASAFPAPPRGLSTWAPESPSAEVALRRAAQELRDKHRLVRGLKGGAFAIVEERETNEGLEYDHVMTARLDAAGRLEIQLVPGAPRTDDDLVVREAFDRHLETLSTEDVSSWMVRLADRCLDAVSLRESGGIYFVPPAAQHRIQALRAALGACSGHVVHRVPAMRSQDAVRAVLDAVESEAATFVEHTRQELLDAGKLGPRALENRRAWIELMEQKVGRYEDLLGSKLEALRERMAELQSQVTVAMLAAEAAVASKEGA